MARGPLTGKIAFGRGSPNKGRPDSRGTEMAGLSISRAWDETREVIARDGKLIFTVALALMALPGAIGEFVSPGAGQNPDSPAAAAIAIVIGIIGLVGQLAIVRLAVGPSLTVGEAIAHGARRALPYLGSVIILILGLLLLALPFVGIMVALGVDLEPPIDTVPASAWLVMLLFLVLAIAIGVRLLLSSPVASLEQNGPIGILRRSWELTGGHFWRLFGFLLLFLIAAVVVLGVVAMIAGLLGAVAGEPEPLSASALISALITALASAVVTGVFVVMLTRIYLQVAGRDDRSEDLAR